MPLTADDVRNKQFDPSRLVRRGYDESQVDNFLDEVVAALGERDARIDTLQLALTGGPDPTAATHPVPAAAASEPAPAAPEAATALLALAQRTAEEHVAAGDAAAAETVAKAEREATATLTAAQAEARRLIEEAEEQRQTILATVYSEQQQVAEATAGLRATAERAHNHLQAYLNGLLRQVQELPVGHQPPELTALSA